MEETTTTNTVQSTLAVAAPQPSTQHFSWLSGITVPIIVEVIGLACVTVWFHRKMSAASQQIAELTTRLEEAESAIERHENVLKKVMTLLGKQNGKPAQLQQTVKPTQAQPTQAQPAQAQPAQVRLAQQHRSIIQLDGFDMEPIMAFGLAQTGVEQQQPTITELSPEDLDAELKSEIGELQLS